MSFNGWMGDRVNNIGKWAENIASDSPDKQPTQFQSWAAETFPNINRWLGGSPSGGGNQPPNKPPNITTSTSDPNNSSRGNNNMGLAAAAPLVAPVLGSGAQFLMSQLGKSFDTRQAEETAEKQAARAVKESEAQALRDKLSYEDRATFDAMMQGMTEERMAGLGNRVANANTSRDMAFDTARQLNTMYTTAGNRLNDAAANTQRSLQGAAATVASMFR